MKQAICDSGCVLPVFLFLTVTAIIGDFIKKRCVLFAPFYISQIKYYIGFLRDFAQKLHFLMRAYGV